MINHSEFYWYKYSFWYILKKLLWKKIKIKLKKYDDMLFIINWKYKLNIIDRITDEMIKNINI